MPEPESHAALPDVSAPLHRAVIEMFRMLRSSRPPGAPGLSRIGLLARLQRGGPASAGALAEALGMQPQSITRILADLARQGLIRRRPDPDDGRRVLVELTRAGADLLRRDVQAQRRGLAAAIDASLTPAEAEILRVAATLMLRVADDVRSAAGR